MGKGWVGKEVKAESDNKMGGLNEGVEEREGGKEGGENRKRGRGVVEEPEQHTKKRGRGKAD